VVTTAGGGDDGCCGESESQAARAKTASVANTAGVLRIFKAVSPFVRDRRVSRCLHGLQGFSERLLGICIAV
jgi:adenylylsulfate kinase-like enzyme